MSHWVGEKWSLKAGPQSGPGQAHPATGSNNAEADNDPQRVGYKETFVQEYDGIKVYHHQGSYQHINKQVHTWSFYEYRMVINGECWNIVMSEDMNKPPGNFPGSNSAKLTHDFCHLDSESSDDVYTHFSFVEMGGRTIWPFYATESFQENLWIWISPRRFAIISNHPQNEKLNHFYSNKMHDHHILALRTPCWSYSELVNDSGKVKDKVIALNEDNRCSLAFHETFLTGFEHKYATKPGMRKEEHLHGKRKYSHPSGQTSTKQFDPSGNYSARDMQALDATFADQPNAETAPKEPTHTTSKVTMWRHGEVPPLGPASEGRARITKQLEYARTLLAAVMEAATQMEEVVENLEQIETEHKQTSEEAPAIDAPQEPRPEQAPEASNYQ